MKHLLLIFFGFCVVTTSKAQSDSEDFHHNEANFNLVNAFAIESVEVGYEHFFEFDQSVGIKMLINDRINYHKETKNKKFHTNSIRLNYTYYFGNYDPGSGFYMRPFVKYRFGSFKEKINGQTKKTDLNAFLIGIGFGYEWVLGNNFVVSPFVNAARSFKSEVKERFSSFEFNGGVNVGYRF